MKIDGPGKTYGTRGVTKTDAKKKAGAAGFTSLVEEDSPASASKPVTGAIPMGQIDALLSLQEAGDGTSPEAQARAKKRAAELLAHLDQVRVGILSGGIPKASLQQLSRLVGTHRDNVMDPVLANILDEIDLRARVELAKHDRDHPAVP